MPFRHVSVIRRLVGALQVTILAYNEPRRVSRKGVDFHLFIYMDTSEESFTSLDRHFIRSNFIRIIIVCFTRVEADVYLCGDFDFLKGSGVKSEWKFFADSCADLLNFRALKEKIMVVIYEVVSSSFSSFFPAHSVWKHIFF